MKKAMVYTLDNVKINILILRESSSFSILNIFIRKCAKVVHNDMTGFYDKIVFL